jgi:RNA polymerase sigma-70 factor (ECF subfamily)
MTLATALLGDRNAAEDVVHDVFAMLVSEVGRLGNGSNISSFLTTCVRNRALDVCRRRKHQARTGSTALLMFPDKKTSDPSEQSVGEERRQILMAAVQELPDGLRETVSLRIWGGLTFEEIGKIQRVTKAAAHNKYQQALAQMREVLACFEGGVK